MNSSTPNVQDPDLCVTGLGSLGLPLPQGALRLIEQYCPQCPHWPQLPVRSPQERALSQFTAGWGVLKPGGGSGELWTWPEEVSPQALDEAPTLPSPEAAMGLHLFAQALVEGRFPQARYLKGQMTGPFTLGQSILYRGRPLLASAPHRNALLRWTARAVRAQAHLLVAARPGLPVLLYLDDPLLARALSGDGPIPASLAVALLADLLVEVRSPELKIGLNIQALHENWDILLKLPLDVIALDAAACLHEFLQSGAILREYLHDGGWISLGLVEPDLELEWVDLGEEHEPAEEPAPVVWARQTIFHLLLNLMQEWSGDLEEVGLFLRQTLVTPSSGLGQFGPEACELQLQLCDLLAFMLRDGFQRFISGDTGGFEI
jgi:hypothetical protein